mgnify:CR=1 FL=1
MDEQDQIVLGIIIGIDDAIIEFFQKSVVSKPAVS